MTAFLPQDDPNPSQRALQLEKARQEYSYNHSYVSPLALVDRVPIHDEFSFRWLEMVAHRVMEGLDNMANIEMEEANRKLHRQKQNIFKRALKAGQAEISGLRYIVEDALKFNGRLGAEYRRPDDLDEYQDLFQKIGLPPVAREFQQDQVFASMRTGGPNSVMLQRMDSLDERLPLTDDHLSRVIPGDCLESAIEEHRLYFVDYRTLDGAECNDYPHGPKFIFAPIAAFVIDPSNRELKPIAIQCQQHPGPDNPIFGPSDGWNWMIAKTVVEIADGNVHEAVTHLGRTHLFIEPFVVSTYRQLAADHPVGKLLLPHFEGTLAINNAAYKHLIADKGAVDKLFGTSIKTVRGLTADSVASMEVNQFLLPLTFETRGVQDVETFPDYPFRDDSSLYWAAIRRWVHEYLCVYYLNDGDVAGDEELQAWGRELVANQGGRINGLGQRGEFVDRQSLCDTLTLIIYTCSVQHAAVNFPQFDLMSYVPNMPLASYSDVTKSTHGATEQDFLNMLPPMDMAELQMDLGHLLGTVHYTQLGQYHREHFRDSRITGPLADFRHRLEQIGQTIEQRNLNRRPYTFLLPAGIPQSINI